MSTGTETDRICKIISDKCCNGKTLHQEACYEDGIVDGWDDPRLVSIAALRRRGFTPESIRKFVELCGVSKSQSSVDYAMLEYCIREDLKMKKPRMMAVFRSNQISNRQLSGRRSRISGC